MNRSEKFLMHYPPDENGWTDIIKIEELIKIDPTFDTKNGCDWARNNIGVIGKKYNIKKFNAKEMGIKNMRYNKTVAIQLQGFKEKIENHNIPEKIRKALEGKPCVVLGIIAKEMEIDHKNGKYDSENYTIDDFQRMSKAANDAKREHCKKCKATNCRFKATTLGYPIDFYEGDENSSFCVGCFWYDPIAFRKSLLK